MRSDFGRMDNVQPRDKKGGLAVVSVGKRETLG